METIYWRIVNRYSSGIVLCVFVCVVKRLFVMPTLVFSLCVVSSCVPLRTSEDESESRRLLSIFMDTDSVRYLPKEQLSRILPSRYLMGYGRSFYTYGAPDFAGPKSSVDSFAQGKVPVAGVMSVRFTGVRGDTVFGFGVMIRDGQLEDVESVPLAVSELGSDGYYRNKYVLGELISDVIDDRCVLLIFQHYDPILLDTVTHHIYDEFAKKLRVDTLSRCYPLH